MPFLVERFELAAADTRPWMPGGPPRRRLPPGPAAACGYDTHVDGHGPARPPGRHGRHRAASSSAPTTAAGTRPAARPPSVRGGLTATPSGCCAPLDRRGPGEHRQDRLVREGTMAAARPQSPHHRGQLLLTNARVFDGTGDDVVADGAVWVSGGTSGASVRRGSLRRRARGRAPRRPRRALRHAGHDRVACPPLLLPATVRTSWTRRRSRRRCSTRSTTPG